MEIKKVKEWIRFKMCEGRLVGNTIPEIDEPWQAGETAIKSIEAWINVIKSIERSLEEERNYNEKLNRASDFYMTHEIAKTSGEIHAMVRIENMIKENIPEIFEEEIRRETENGKQDKD